MCGCVDFWIWEYFLSLRGTIGFRWTFFSPNAFGGRLAFFNRGGSLIDWHSSVHGHWMLVELLKRFPDLETAGQIKKQLAENISAANIKQEVAYFEGKHNTSYERTYGWAWLLKLSESLQTWDDPLGKELASNLEPLTQLIRNRYLEFLPKLYYPIRVGEHTNTGFGLAFAWDYANTVKDTELLNLMA